ncbi:hypothetical protein PMI16_01037 [Herbaspirillum sp. CF444]|nr:hypothetical protein PMI16_01037 [Herbaspirillum sp. CF444]
MSIRMSTFNYPPQLARARSILTRFSDFSSYLHS